MRNPYAYAREPEAIEKARELQRDAKPGELYGVERDHWKEPYSYRVVCFDLNLESDRSYIVPPGYERVSRVVCVMFARRLTLIVPPARPATPKARPAAPDLIGDYKAKRRSRRAKVAA